MRSYILSILFRSSCYCFVVENLFSAQRQVTANVSVLLTSKQSEETYENVMQQDTRTLCENKAGNSNKPLYCCVIDKIY